MPRKNCPYKNLAPLRGASRAEEQAVLQNPKFVTEEQNVLVNEGDNIRSLSPVLNTYNTIKPTKPSLFSWLTTSGLCRNHPQCDYQHHQTTKTILVILAINNIKSKSTVFNTNIINNPITTTLWHWIQTVIT